MHEAVADRKPAPVPEPLPAQVVDAHTHLDACGCLDAADVVAAADRAAAVGVTRLVTVADDLASAHWAARAATWDPRVFAAVALHPTRADTLDDAARREIESLAGSDRVVAIGETGLDFYWDAAPHDVQREAFAWHIDLAKRTGKALMIHDRQAHEAIFDVLDGEGAPETVVFHCYSGDAEMARRCADRGWVLSFAGPVTFKNARDLAEAAAVIPGDLYMAETDAPFLTPHPHRGRRNEPYALPWTVRALAALRDVDLDTVCDQVRGTAERVYRLPQPTA
ncbi:YchF/TatD family DNA exonuclease [Nakamurella sp. YIM 132087]|uniref:YchF/TatD family DNA exonuclease n=1 Tax=Nakamurella alba TaxID=2665158 RepID=A0A7K1FF27_9ACTN|nr:YchF/TatD family DNA exonuclease [Nakamurella alba]